MNQEPHTQRLKKLPTPLKPPEPEPEPEVTPGPELDLSGVKDLQTFPHKEFGSVRVVMINNDPWFVAKDVAKILEYDQTANMLKRLDDDEKSKIASSNLDGANSRAREFAVINESGLYHAILGSKKPDAVKFRKWVTGNVLPSLRKHEQYNLGQETMDDEELLAKVLQGRG